MKIDTSKLTKKDVGEHMIQTDISLAGNSFKTETEKFKLTISDDNGIETSNEGSSLNGNETLSESSSLNGNETLSDGNETSSESSSSNGNETLLSDGQDLAT